MSEITELREFVRAVANLEVHMMEVAEYAKTIRISSPDEEKFFVGIDELLILCGDARELLQKWAKN